MECRLLLVSLAALLLAPPSDSVCPKACECRDPQLKCTSYVPEVAWLNDIPDPSGYRELWLDKLEVPVLASHARQLADCSRRAHPYCREFPTVTLTRYIWQANESAAMSLAVEFFSSRPGLKHLNVSRNDFEDIDWCRNVSGVSLATFNASHNEIRRVARDTFRNMDQLTELVLSDNQLSELSPELKSLRKLQLLDVSNNRILKLNDALKSMPELRRVNLAGNKISFMRSDYFQDLRGLVELDISRNAFVFIRPESLQSLTSLAVLNLSENRLIERDLSLLLDSVRRLEVVDASRIGLWRVPATLTRSVKILKLVGNQLTAINSGDFDSYPLLQFLDLSGNKLIAIEDDALGRLDNLERLNLYGNILSSVPKSLPSNLKSLDLRQNVIAAVMANDLRGLSDLERLDLSGNVVSSIENGAFRHATSLRELDVSDNPVKRLTADALGGPKLWRLRVAGLTEFKLDENQNQDTAFPYSTPEYLGELDLSRSSALAALFMADNATLSACKRLASLDLSNTNVSAIRSDLHYVLPELRILLMNGNEFDCGVWTDHRETCHEHRAIDFEMIRIHESRNLTGRASTTTTVRPRREHATTMESPTTSTVGRVKASSESQLKKEFDMLVRPTATPPTTVFEHATTDSPTTKVEDEVSSTRSAETLATTTRTEIRESTTPAEVTGPSSTYFGEERPDLFTLRRAKVVNKKTTAVEDDRTTTTRLPSTARLLPTYRKKAKTTTTTARTTTDEAPPAVINLDNDATTTRYEESPKSPSSRVFSEFSRSKMLLASDDEQASAEELINERGHRNSEFFSSGAHPGMLILVGAVVGAAAALTVVLSRRATAKGREQYHRQENIALTPTTEQRW